MNLVVLLLVLDLTGADVVLTGGGRVTSDDGFFPSQEHWRDTSMSGHWPAWSTDRQLMITGSLMSQTILPESTTHIDMKVYIHVKILTRLRKICRTKHAGWFQGWFLATPDVNDLILAAERVRNAGQTVSYRGYRLKVILTDWRRVGIDKWSPVVAGPGRGMTSEDDIMTGSVYQGEITSPI